jgi:hypothetical protein
MARLGVIAAAILAASSFAALGLVVSAQTNDPVGENLRKTATTPKADNAPVAPEKSKAVNAAVNAPAPQARSAPTSPITPEPKAPPDRRPRFPVAILQALDKVTAESMRFEAPVGQPIRYHNLVFTVRSCETTTADEPAEDAIAFVEVEAHAANAGRAAPLTRQVFKGWMFAAEPSVNPLQHPVYDAWLIACKA